MGELISKMEAADRQLRTALVLFLQHGDPIAIHTLASAARNIYRDLSKVHGNPSFLTQAIGVVIRPEYIKEFRDSFRAPEVFLKHAYKDPDAILDFEPNMNLYVLLICAKEREQLEPTRTTIQEFIYMLVGLKLPHLLSDGWKVPVLAAGLDLDYFARLPDSHWLKTLKYLENTPKPGAQT